MIDIHCHPLPETDDGAKDFDVAVAMLKMAHADGVTHVVATPHCNFRYAFNAAGNKAKAAELQATIGAAPEVLLGCDFRLSYENIGRLAQAHAAFSINGSQYLLVEFVDHFIPGQMDHVFYDIQVAGLTPILTHPERNAVCRRKLQHVYNWVARGCLVQVTAQSYTGSFGPEPLRAVEELLDLNMVHFVASDAHDAKHRPPILSAAYEKMISSRGQELADRLFTCNPAAVIHGKLLPAAPMPASPDGRKKWWSFLKR